MPLAASVPLITVDIHGDDPERIPLSEEESARLNEAIRKAARKLTAYIYLASISVVKDEKTGEERAIEQGYIRELLTEESQRTMRFLVANPAFLEEGMAQTLSDFLNGYLPGKTGLIPIPAIAASDDVAPVSALENAVPESRE